MSDGDDHGRAAAQAPWPTQIRLVADKRRLHVAYDDGAAFDLPGELLRVFSPSAEVQGHGPGQRKTVGGKRKVAIVGVEPVGNYAVRLRFDDGHDTGIFSWAYLRELGMNLDARMRAYEAELKAKGLNRDEPGEK